MVITSDVPATQVPAAYSRNWTVVGHCTNDPAAPVNGCQWYTNCGLIPRELNHASICASVIDRVAAGSTPLRSAKSDRTAPRTQNGNTASSVVERGIRRAYR